MTSSSEVMGLCVIWPSGAQPLPVNSDFGKDITINPKNSLLKPGDDTGKRCLSISYHNYLRQIETVNCVSNSSA